MQHVFKTENQCHRNSSLFTQRQQGKSRPHVTNVTIGSRQGLYGRIRNTCLTQKITNHKNQKEDGVGGGHIGKNEVYAGQLLNRRFGDQFEKQRRERNINDECVEPRQSFRWMRSEPGRAISNEDQPEKRQHKADNINHNEFT